jgi:hypothetical protein
MNPNGHHRAEAPHLNGKSHPPDELQLPAWLVQETLYDPSGRRLGMMRQRHVMTPRPDGTIRVVITCEPLLDIANPSLDGLAGEWRFDLGREADELVYYGPDITGRGRNWGERTLTTTGLWGRAGLHTVAYSIVRHAGRQVVGSVLNRVGDADALIGSLTTAQPGVTVAFSVGVGQPDGGVGWPAWCEPTWPGEVASRWAGTRQRYDAAGALIETLNIRREYTRDGWRDLAADGATLDALRLDDVGVRRLDWLVMRSNAAGLPTEQLDILDADADGPQVVGLRRTLARDYPGHRETGLDVLLLTPAR